MEPEQAYAETKAIFAAQLRGAHFDADAQRILLQSLEDIHQQGDIGSATLTALTAYSSALSGKDAEAFSNTVSRALDDLKGILTTEEGYAALGDQPGYDALIGQYATLQERVATLPAMLNIQDTTGTPAAAAYTLPVSAMLDIGKLVGR